MKRFLFLSIVLALTACGAGNVAVTTTPVKSASAAPKAGKAYLAFSSQGKENIVVTVDGKEYRTETIQVKSPGGTQNIKSLSNDILTVDPGSHEVVVKNKQGVQVYKGRISVSAQEHKVINL